jgi:hypothetical protein
MKDYLLIPSIIAIMVFTGLSVFGQQNGKAEEARKDEASAQDKLRLAKIDSAADFQKFKEGAEAKISENEREIIDLKTNKIIKDKDANIKYDNKVLALEQKNDELKKKIEAADGTKTDMWSSFKTSFNHDMEELGEAMKSI